MPHRGAMCLLQHLVAWDATRIECVAPGQRDPAHPLRSRSGLMAGAAIEYAAQAAALHGGLLAEAAGASAAPGYLASARDVRLGAWRLDDLPVAATATTPCASSPSARRATRAPALRLSRRARRTRGRRRAPRRRPRRGAGRDEHRAHPRPARPRHGRERRHRRGDRRAARARRART
jgi:hypothetical protein